jgi:hypothetical protein
MEDENGWKRLDKHLLARLTEARRTEVRRLQVRDARDCVFYSVHRIMLWIGEFSMSVICVGGWETDPDVELE